MATNRTQQNEIILDESEQMFDERNQANLSKLKWNCLNQILECWNDNVNVVYVVIIWELTLQRGTHTHNYSMNSWQNWQLLCHMCVWCVIIIRYMEYWNEFLKIAGNQIQKSIITIKEPLSKKKKKIFEGNTVNCARTRPNKWIKKLISSNVRIANDRKEWMKRKGK